jgi:PQQ-like domain
VRVDAGSRRVVARIPLAGSPVVAAGSGAVWILSGGGGYTFPGPLLAVDPRTNRVDARIPLKTTAGRPFSGEDIVPVPGAVWVVGPDGAIRVDALSHQVTASITVATSRGFVADGASDGRSMWLVTQDGRLVRVDARTGARLSSAHTELDQPTNVAADAAGVFVVGAHGVARLDPGSGRQVWRTTTSGQVDSVVVAHGRLWAVTPGTYGANVISAYDPATGRHLTTTALPDFVGSALAATGSDVWALGDNGKVDVVKP